MPCLFPSTSESIQAHLHNHEFEPRLSAGKTHLVPSTSKSDAPTSIPGKQHQPRQCQAGLPAPVMQWNCWILYADGHLPCRLGTELDTSSLQCYCLIIVRKNTQKYLHCLTGNTWNIEGACCKWREPDCSGQELRGALATTGLAWATLLLGCQQKVYRLTSLFKCCKHPQTTGQ